MMSDVDSTQHTDALVLLGFVPDWVNRHWLRGARTHYANWEMSNHWKMLVAVVVLAGGASSVAIADGYEPVGKGFAAPSQVNWTGVYIGGHVGYGWGDAESTYDFGKFNEFLFDEIGLNRKFGQDTEGWMGGVHLGAQWQYGKWVIGVEGTYDAMDRDGSSSVGWEFGEISGSPPFAFGLAGEGTQSLKTEIDDLFTITGRVGYAWNRWLTYVKGGYARAEVDVKSSVGGEVIGCFFGCLSGPVGFSGSSNEDHDGWIVGAGVEYMVHNNVTLGVEYDYVKLESKTHVVDGAVEICCDIDFPASHRIDVDPDAIQSVSARLTFLFGP